MKREALSHPVAILGVLITTASAVLFISLIIAILAGLLLIGLNAGAASARLHDPDLTAQAIAAHASITHGCWLARVGTEITSKPTTPRDSYRVKSTGPPRGGH